MGEIRWTRPKDSYLTSAGGRFQIVPIYRSTVKPDAYWLEDRVVLHKGRATRMWCFTVKEAKARAEFTLRRERQPQQPPRITPDML